jgi:two-component system sensor histidine kinase AlgZ
MTDANPAGGLPAMSGRERYLPDFRSLGTTLILSLLGQLLAFMFTLAEASSPAGFWSGLGLNSLFILWIVLPGQAVLAIVAKQLDRMRAVRAGWCVFIVVQAACLLMTWLVYALSQEAGEPLVMRGGNLPFQLLDNALLAGLVTAVGLRYQYVQYLRRLQARAESSARLDALQARMRPHFLFNSLNAIASLTRRNPALAEELTLDLAELFRAILRKDVRLTTLGEEFVLSRQYLNIERQRLGDRLRVAWALDEDLLAAMIPPLSLQPLLENAVYHGIEPSAEGGTLEISCQPHKKDKIILTVRNSLPGQNERMDRPGNSIALENLRLRLQNFFGDEGRLTVSMAEGFYQARIIIPYTTRRTYEDIAGR